MNRLNNPAYTPNAMLNKVLELMQLETDQQLSKALNCSRYTICHIRGKRLGVSPEFLLKLHDLTGRPAKELRKWMGVES